MQLVVSEGSRDLTTDRLVWPTFKDFQALVPFPQSCLILFQTGAVRPALGLYLSGRRCSRWLHSFLPSSFFQFSVVSNPHSDQVSISNPQRKDAIPSLVPSNPSPLRLTGSNSPDTYYPRGIRDLSQSNYAQPQLISLYCFLYLSKRKTFQRPSGSKKVA